jgi:hypothetical protein
MHTVFVASVVVYIVCGEGVNWLLAPFEGFAGSWIQRNELWIRIGLMSVFTANVIPVFTFYTRDTRVDKEVVGQQRKQPIDAALIGRALHVVQIEKMFPFLWMSVAGLVLFTAGGERIDLYLFCSLSLLGLVLVRPRRAHWERTFQRHAAKYPAVPANPWLTP